MTHTNRFLGLISFRNRQQNNDIKEVLTSGPNDQFDGSDSDNDEDEDGGGGGDYVNDDDDNDRGSRERPCPGDPFRFGANRFNGYDEWEDSDPNSTPLNPMMSMDLQSITTAYREGDGCSFGYYSGHTRQTRSIASFSDERDAINTRDFNSVSDFLVTSRGPHGHKDPHSLNEAKQMLSIQPICPVYYESDRQYGNYQQYRHIKNDRVGGGHEVRESICND